MRICSLLPSATEIVFALGAGRSLVAVTHECDYPPETAVIRRVTSSKIRNAISSGQIDAAVSSALIANGSLYDLDMAAFEEVQPDLVLSQELCPVCAASFKDVNQAIQSLRSRPTVLYLEPHSLADILTSIRIVGQAIGFDSQAETLVMSLKARIEAIRYTSRNLPSRPRVVCLEWVDPP
jgi:iron complex transport system substrate-binding protein